MWFVRYDCLQKLVNHVNEHEGGIDKFSKGYEEFGLVKKSGGLLCQEWAPAAEEVYIYGDFSEFVLTCLFKMVAKQPLCAKDASDAQNMYDNLRTWIHTYKRRTCVIINGLICYFFFTCLVVHSHSVMLIKKVIIGI